LEDLSLERRCWQFCSQCGAAN